MINDFNNNTMKIQGSGYGWIAYAKNTKKLCWLFTKDQDPLLCLSPQYIPIFTVDIWEHAFYPTYKNDKKTFLTNIWKIANWGEMEKRFEEVIRL